jgi:hypothetical protein
MFVCSIWFMSVDKINDGFVMRNSSLSVTISGGRITSIIDVALK